MRRKSEASKLAKESMVKALVDLMKTTPYASISITEITRHAGVSRMAYYRNYVSKDDILNQYMDEVGAKIHRLINESGAVNNVQSYFRTLFEELGKYSDIGIATYRAHMSELISNNVKKYMKITFCPGDTSIESEYLVSCYAGAFYAMFMMWISDGKKESPDELAVICSRALNIRH